MDGIGRNIKKRAQTFSVTVIYPNRRELDASLADSAEYVSFEELLKRSDVLSLNLPLNPTTRHTLSTEQFRLMKPSAVVARGLVAGAGLDVYEEEPRVHPGLVGNDRVMLLPHMGSWTSETMEKMEAWAIENVRPALEKGELNSSIFDEQGMHT